MIEITRENFEKEFGKIHCENCNSKVQTRHDFKGRFYFSCDCMLVLFEDLKECLETNNREATKEFIPNYWKWSK